MLKILDIKMISTNKSITYKITDKVKQPYVC
jgi:hypothetical protein